MRFRALGLLFVGVLFGLPAWAGDRHAGYYYPEVSSTETYDLRMGAHADAGRAMRLSFVSHMTKEQAAAEHAPQYAIFAKGTDGEKLIIVGLDEDAFGTLFRARGVMAQMTAFTRELPFLKEAGLASDVTFYDFLGHMGFKRLTLTDGRAWSHRVELE